METVEARHSVRFEEGDFRAAPQAEVAASSLASNLDQLSAVIAHLEDRLRFVLDPAERVSDDRELDSPRVSPISDLLFAHARTVGTMSQRLSSIIDRLDLPA